MDAERQSIHTLTLVSSGALVRRGSFLVLILSKSLIIIRKIIHFYFSYLIVEERHRRLYYDDAQLSLLSISSFETLILVIFLFPISFKQKLFFSIEVHFHLISLPLLMNEMHKHFITSLFNK